MNKQCQKWFQSFSVALMAAGCCPAVEAQVVPTIKPPDATLGDPSSIHLSPLGDQADDSASLLYLRAATWNVEQLGANTGLGASKDIYSFASVMVKFDLVGIQGLGDPTADQSLQDALAGQSSSKWRSTISSIVGSESDPIHARSYYAFYWRDNRVSFLQKSGVYHDPDGALPAAAYYAEFAFKGHPFVWVQVNLDGIHIDQHQAAGIALYDLVDKLKKVFPNEPVFLAGDLEMDTSDNALKYLLSVARPLVVSGGSKLSVSHSGFGWLYDNIFTTLSSPINAGVYPYMSEMGLKNREATAKMSSHAPVFCLPLMD